MKAIRKKIVKATIVKMFLNECGRVDPLEPERESEKQRIECADKEVSDDAHKKQLDRVYYRVC